MIKYYASDGVVWAQDVNAPTEPQNTFGYVFRNRLILICYCKYREAAAEKIARILNNPLFL